MRDERTNDEQVKIELLSQWKLEAEFRNFSLSQARSSRKDINLEILHPQGVA